MWTREKSKLWIEETCGTGWLKLVDEVYDLLPEHLNIVQAYQKYASLNFDLDQDDEAFQDFLSEIKERSTHICEICGDDGFHTIVNGWETTLCSHHYENAAGLKYKSS